MFHPPFSLAQLGWRPVHSQQLTLRDLEAGYPARVMAVHRDTLAVLSERGTQNVSVPPRLLDDTEGQITVGDWVLLEAAAPRVLRLIERQSIIARLAAGIESRMQTIAANLDTLFVVSSCNEDFNLSRLERYLAVAREAQIEPVIVLTKADLCGDPAAYVEQARTISSNVAIQTLDATNAHSTAALSPWLQSGQTVAFVGSSGVGKSTLVNTLTRVSSQVTAGIREDDAKGRHTTTARQMFALASGAWVIDTPGMRELKVGAVEAGVRAVFDDIEALAARCRFRDCQHDGDAGCAVIAAVNDGQLDARRLTSYLKLQRESEQATLSIRERRARDRHFGRMYRSAQRLQRRKKGQIEKP